VGQALFGGLGLITATLVYYDLRVRREAFDLRQRVETPDAPGTSPATGSLTPLDSHRADYSEPPAAPPRSPLEE
jgi:hypothetical protein